MSRPGKTLIVFSPSDPKTPTDFPGLWTKHCPSEEFSGSNRKVPLSRLPLPRSFGLLPRFLSVSNIVSNFSLLLHDRKLWWYPSFLFHIPIRLYHHIMTIKDIYQSSMLSHFKSLRMGYGIYHMLLSNIYLAILPTAGSEAS